MTNDMEKITSDSLAEQAEKTYQTARDCMVEAQNQVYHLFNSAMIQVYWIIGKEIHEACGENERDAYEKQLLAELSKRLTAEYGEGFDESNLRSMRRFYAKFPIQDALRPELSWNHYRELTKIADPKAREFYLQEAANSGWSSKELWYQINSMYYERILASKDNESVEKEKTNRKTLLPIMSFVSMFSVLISDALIVLIAYIFEYLPHASEYMHPVREVYNTILTILSVLILISGLVVNFLAVNMTGEKMFKTGEKTFFVMSIIGLVLYIVVNGFFIIWGLTYYGAV